MKKSKETAVAILCLAMCISLLAGCGGGNSGAGNQNGGQQAVGSQVSSGTEGAASTAEPYIEEEEEVWYAEAIVIVADGSISVLDPMDPSSNTIPAFWAFTMIHDRLLERDAGTGEIMPAVAIEWNSADNRTFRFLLRDDAVFHDGEKLTASDVVFTVGRGKESPGSEAYAIWSQVEAARVISDFEIELVLTAVNASFFTELTTPVAGILCETSFTFDPDFAPAIGTGAYAVIDFRQDNYVQLVRNETYWGASKNIITDWVRLQCVPDAATVISMIQYDEAQIYCGTKNEIVSMFEGDTDDFDIYRHDDIVVSAKGIGGVVWTHNVRNTDLRGIHCVVDYYH